VSRKHKKFRFTFAVFIRVLVFILIIYFLINFINNKKIAPNLAQPNFLYEQIPDSTKEKLNNVSSLPVFLTFRDKITDIQTQGTAFIQYQIKEAQKALVKKIYDDAIRKIDQPQSQTQPGTN